MGAAKPAQRYGYAFDADETRDSELAAVTSRAWTEERLYYRAAIVRSAVTASVGVVTPAVGPSTGQNGSN